MQLTQERYGDALVLNIAGRVDNSTTDGLKSTLDEYVAGCRAGGDRLVLDFSKVDYISSVGLRVLMLAARQSRAPRSRTDGLKRISGLSMKPQMETPSSASRSLR